MIKLALTGSIGMGKPATAIRGAGRADHDAMRRRMRRRPGGEAVAPLEWAFPGIIGANGGSTASAARAW
jgi:hypothetical protein